MKNNLNKALRCLSWIFLPYAIFNLIKEGKTYREIMKLLHNAVNYNNHFFNFLKNMDFKRDWFGRLYTVQMVADNNIDDDMAYDFMMRSLLPFREVFEQTAIIDVVGLDVRQVEPKMFLCLLGPFNHNEFMKRWYDFFISSFVTVSLITIMLLIF